MSWGVRKGRLKKLIAAFICWCKGYAEWPDETWRRQNREEELGEGITIKRCDIPDLLGATDFVDALNLWVDYKAFGSPYGGGYMDWPCQMYDVIRCFDSLYPRYRDDK